MVQKHVNLGGTNYILENNSNAAPPPAPMAQVTGANLFAISSPLAQATMNDLAFYGNELLGTNPADAQKLIQSMIMGGRIRVFQ